MPPGILDGEMGLVDGLEGLSVAGGEGRMMEGKEGSVEEEVDGGGGRGEVVEEGGSGWVGR